MSVRLWYLADEQWVSMTNTPEWVIRHGEACFVRDVPLYRLPPPSPIRIDLSELVVKANISGVKVI